jgi:hypothetical protein
MGSVILTGIQVLGLATAIAVSAGFCQTQSWDYIRRQTGFPGTDSGRSDRVLPAASEIYLSTFIPDARTLSRIVEMTVLSSLNYAHLQQFLGASSGLLTHLPSSLLDSRPIPLR